jgi:transcriptional regulator with XRE-family HTH domain
MTFGSEIRRLRRAKQLNLRELAGMADIDFTYLSKVENDKLPPPAEGTIRKLAQALDTEVDELILLAKKIPKDLASQLVSSHQTVELLRSMEGRVYSPEEWKDLMKMAREKGRPS